jgi:2-polyprenyl-3-methyl-5-hydroxy-6-metoxy-1,4-benzoquinol methylase
MDRATNVASYVHALEAFDGIEQLQELKVIARQRGGIARGCSILDVGCGFGLETLRLASLVAPGGKVAGIAAASTLLRRRKSAPPRRNCRSIFASGMPRRFPTRMRALIACGPSGC